MLPGNITKYYRIRQKSTGLYFSGIKVIPPLTKKGIPSKAIIIPRKVRRQCKYEAEYLSGDMVRLDEYDNLICQLEDAVHCGCNFDGNDLELELYMIQTAPLGGEEDLKDKLSEFGQDRLAKILTFGK